MISKNYKIKPSARIITTIGENLIKDTIAAIVELVKNAYDADAKNVNIEFSNHYDEKNQLLIKIRISDDGHGMDLNTVISKWMVPATDDKYKRHISPKGRTLQGRKGIGRYAAALLGEKLKLDTVDLLGNKTIVDIDWEKFKNTEYLEDISIPIKSYKSDENHGTMLEIIGKREQALEWSDDSINNLINELKKLVSPISKSFRDDIIDDEFNITLKFNDFYMVDIYQTESIDIEPVKLIDLYDYRLNGTISNEGEFNLIFIDNVSSDTEIKEEIKFKYTHTLGYEVGNIKIDFRVFDRDPESIQNIIRRGLSEEFKDLNMGKNEAKQCINDMSGVGIYRGGFKVRPYGDSGYDWLELDKARVQNPSKKIGSNQIIGFVEIESEEKSHLEEKSARDGLRENIYYSYFKELLRKAINELEIRRFSIRKSVGRGRRKDKLGKQIEGIFNFDKLSNDIEEILSKEQVDKEKINLVKNKIRDEEIKKSKELKEIEKIIAIYQGQATLGKIMMILMHEGRKPLFWFKNQTKLMNHYLDKFNKEDDKDSLIKIKKNLPKYNNQAEILLNLFSKLEPLAQTKRFKKNEFNIKKVINESVEVFENQLKENGIKVNIDCNENISYLGFETDFLVTLTNLIENSIYWLTRIDKVDKFIEIIVYGDSSLNYINFRDNGPGINKDFIESEVIFEPEFTTKYNSSGTGLGLAIAGEACKRNNIDLKAIYSKEGAHFIMSVEREMEIDDE